MTVSVRPWDQIAADLPDCPRCGGTGWIPDAPRHAILPCPDCDYGKVSVAQLVQEAKTAYNRGVDAAHDDMRSLRPNCPTCGGTKWTTDGPTPDDYMPCVACPDGKVTVAQMAALWEAVHDDDGRDVLSHFSGEYTIDHLRSVRP